MATKRFGLINMFVLMIVFFSCNMENKIVGKYHHEHLGSNYTLELRPDNIFIQTFIRGSDTFINNGKYSISYRTVSCTFWKSKNEMLNATGDKGGCAGCELKYKNGRLNFYSDPDGLPEDVFVKMEK